jgi:mono/diheme cytochrome c family protein
MTVDQKCSAIFLGGIVAAVLLASAGESMAADSKNGQRLAMHWCSGCHVVSPGQQQAYDAAPTFAKVAASGLDEGRLKAFLANPEHSRMPNLSLSRSEIADLVAYIKTLAPAKPQG